MKFAILSSLALFFQAANVLAEDIQLWANSDDGSISGQGLTSLHEGAGINYFFLANSQDSTMTLSYDAPTEMLSSGVIGFPQLFAVSGYGGYAQLTVAGSSDKFTFDGSGTLLINGTSQGLYACMNTGDPYGYSQSQFELMWYGPAAPHGCLALSLSKNKPSSPSSSSTSLSATTSVVSTSTVSSTVSSLSTVTLTTCTSCSGAVNTSSVHPSTSVASVILSANGAADLAVAPAGLAVAFGLAAYIL